MKQINITGIMGVCALMTSAMTLQAMTYYVDNSIGNDSNAGTSPSAPWRSLWPKVSQFTPNGGDQILLKCGDTWGWPLIWNHVDGNGKSILVGSYGAGAPPKIDVSAQDYLGCIMLTNCSYITISNLALTADSKTSGVQPHRYGVQVVATNYTSQYMQFENLAINDIYPSLLGTQSDGQGIGFVPLGLHTAKSGTFAHLWVLNNCISDIADCGIYALNDWWGSTITTDIRLISNTITNVGKNAFFGTFADSVYIANNDFEWCGSTSDPRQAGRGSTFWYQNCRNVVAENNFLAHSRGSQDSSGLHIDNSNTQVLYQNNVSGKGAALYAGGLGFG